MDSPSLQQLRYFVVLAEELHFGRAAERLGIAQPPLTQQIQKLERLVGCELIARGRKSRLTAAGAALAEDAQRLLSHLEHSLDRVRRTAKGEIGQLRIGVPPSVMLTRLPQIVRRYRRMYPHVGFTLREMATSAIEDALRSGEIDLGFLREARPESPLQTEPFVTEKLVAVFPAKHRLASHAHLTLRDLRAERFVLFPARLGAAFHERILEACRAAGFSPNVVQEATQWQTIVSFVAAGMGVSIAPESVMRLRPQGAIYRPLPGARTTVFAGWNANHLAPAVKPFLELALRT
jgi:DNA-binding transcriptional LysR family regulator